MEDRIEFYSSLCSVPIMSKARFSELTGFELGIVDAWLERGLLPSAKVGKHRAVNLVLITRRCLSDLPLDSDDK